MVSHLCVQAHEFLLQAIGGVSAPDMVSDDVVDKGRACPLVNVYAKYRVKNRRKQALSRQNLLGFGEKHGLKVFVKLGCFAVKFAFGVKVDKALIEYRLSFEMNVRIYAVNEILLKLVRRYIMAWPFSVAGNDQTLVAHVFNRP